MLGWIEVLHEGNYTDGEIDRILSGLNAEYFRIKMTEGMKKEFESELQRQEKKEGRKLTQGEIRALLKHFHSSMYKK